MPPTNFYDTNADSITDYSFDGSASLRFPESLADLGIPYVLFSPYKRDRLVSTGTSAGATLALLTKLPTPSWTIALPIPTSALATDYQVTYETPSFGAVGGTVLSGLQSALGGKVSLAGFNTLKDNLRQGASELVSTGLGAFSAMGRNALAGALDSLVTSGKPALDVLFNNVENPFTEMLFKSVPFREHTFTYKFSPRNLQQSKTIDLILQRFKFFMLPAFEEFEIAGVKNFGTYLQFPYEWQIYYSVNKSTFTLLPSVLTNMKVSYSGELDTPKFFAPDADGNQYPTQISVSMTFKETFILTRNYIDTGVALNTIADTKSETQFSTTYRF